jgi:serine/threonine-protein kinase
MSTIAPARTVIAGLRRSTSDRPAGAVSQLPHYDLLALAAQGTFAEVWKVRDTRTGRMHALKRLTDEGIEHSTSRRLFKNEADVLHKVASDYVVSFSDADLDVATPYIVLEWLSGQTLEARLSRGRRLPCGEALWVARQCAQGMHALLGAGYTHGDIKPSNIFVCHDGSAKLIDLRLASPDQFPAADLAESENDASIGTADNLSSDRFSAGHPSGIAHEVYGLGIALYRMLTGVLPFPSETSADAFKQQQEAAPTRLRHLAPDVPREVAEFVHRLLAKRTLRRGNGLSWLIQELIGLELLMLP